MRWNQNGSDPIAHLRAVPYVEVSAVITLP